MCRWYSLAAAPRDRTRDVAAAILDRTNAFRERTDVRLGRQQHELGDVCSQGPVHNKLTVLVRWCGQSDAQALSAREGVV